MYFSCIEKADSGKSKKILKAKSWEITRYFYHYHYFYVCLLDSKFIWKEHLFHGQIVVIYNVLCVAELIRIVTGINWECLSCLLTLIIILKWETNEFLTFTNVNYHFYHHSVLLLLLLLLEDLDQNQTGDIESIKAGGRMQQKLNKVLVFNQKERQI